MCVLRLTAMVIAAALLTACSERAPVASQTQVIANAPEPTIDESSGDVRHASLNANGIATKYSAYYSSDRLTRIVEQREPQAGGAATGEYSYQGARLLRYRGTKLGDATQIDLQFDVQGALQSGAGPNVAEDEIAAIRNRAQLLRSHALAQSATRGHTSGH